MRAFIISTLILLSGFKALAGFDMVVPEKRVIFNPVVSTSARTLAKWQFGFQRTSGANINSHMLANALSVGVHERVELGTVPIFYATVPGSRNYTAKLNFYRGEKFDWAAAFTENRFKSEVRQDGKVIETPDLVLRSFHIGFNYRPAELEDITLSPFLNNVCGHIDSKNTMTFVYSLKCESEWGLDMQYQIKDREWLTFAWGHLREAGISPYENMNTGAGVAWSQFRPKEMFSRPSVGVYYTPDNGNTLFLLSTTFFEL